MASITGLHGATGEEWYSWPVGTTASALDEVSTSFKGTPDGIANISASIEQCDARLSDQGAVLGSVWAPSELKGVVAAQCWEGILQSPEEDIFRSARRYERSIEGRSFDGTTTVFSQYLTTLYASDVEAVLFIETRSEGDGAEPYIMARALYFPTWTKDRVVFEAICPLLTLMEDFTGQVSAMVSSLTFDSSDS